MELQAGQSTTTHLGKYKSVAVEYTVVHEADGTQWTPIVPIGSSYYGKFM